MNTCNHVLEKLIATDWTRTKIVPVPNCLSCGEPNPTYDAEDENNKFYRTYWDLEFKPEVIIVKLI